MNNEITFLIQQPIREKRNEKPDEVVFYNNIKRVLTEWNHPYTVEAITVSNCHIVPQYKDILLAFHTTHQKNNIWNLKRGYIPYYMNFDRFGYSGWSEMAKSKPLFDESQKTNNEDAAIFVDSFITEYAAGNTSKFPQSTKPFELDKPFLFVACQKPFDTVSKLARIDTYKLAELVVEKLSNKIDIVIKLHPRDLMSQHLNHLKGKPNVHFSNASIHKIIPKSVGVITVNSGVGYEALFYGKHVFTAGETDYQWVTHDIQTEDDISNIINIIKGKPNIDTINKFLFYMMTKHFVKADSIHSIKEHLQNSINRYNQDT